MQKYQNIKCQMIKKQLGQLFFFENILRDCLCLLSQLKRICRQNSIQEKKLKIDVLF